MENNEDSTPLEVLAPSAIMAMERAQIDIQIATAHQYPRSLELFKKRALSMATLDSEIADSCIYVRPVGKEQNAQGKWVEKYAEGPSIRLAEIVAVSYGNIRVFSRVVEQTERFVRCEGFAHDLESNAAMKSECLESTVTRDGKPYSERQRALTAKVCLKKALRDAIFTVVPRALCKPIIDAAKKVAAGQDKSLEERRKKAQAWIGSLKIDEARIFAALGVNGWTDITAEHLTTLTGLKTAMGDGDDTIDSAFPPIQSQSQEVHKPTTTAHQQSQGTVQAETKKPETKPEPAKTAEPEKKGDDNLSFDGATPLAGTSQEAPGVVSATQTPSGAPGPQAEAGSTAETGKTETTTPTQPLPEPDPAFAAKPGESDALLSVKLIGHSARITMSQLLAYLRTKKLCRDDQKLAELSEKKLTDVAKHINAWIPEISKLER